LFKAYAQMLNIKWFIEHLSFNLTEEQTILQMFTSEKHTSLLHKWVNCDNKKVQFRLPRTAKAKCNSKNMYA
jgi:hypothetical protein